MEGCYDEMIKGSSIRLPTFVMAFSVVNFQQRFGIFIIEYWKLFVIWCLNIGIYPSPLSIAAHVLRFHAFALTA
jgi:hypothetical protein